MNMSEEIHSIKDHIITLQQAVNGLVRKFGNVAVMENQQGNDRRAVDALSTEVDRLAEVITTLSTNVATMNGIASGKKTMWLIFGSGITLAIAALVTAVIIHNSTLDVHSAEIKSLKADIKELQGTT